MDELVKKQREEGAEKNFRKMRWACMSCKLSDDPSRNQNFMKPYQDFGVRWASDFITRLLPQGAWARCISCQDDCRGSLGKELGGNNNNMSEAKRRRYGKKGKEYGEMGKEFGEKGKEFGEKGKEFGEMGKELGGSENNPYINERSLAASQACETCEQCGRLLTRTFFWTDHWRHRTRKQIRMTCKECSPTPPEAKLSGYFALNEKRKREAAAKPITCQVCKRS